MVKNEIDARDKAAHAKQRGRALVDHAADPEWQTEVSFSKALQSVAECMSAYAVKLDTTKNCISPFDRLSMSLDYSEEARNLFNQFDKRYRGHVYRQLLKSPKQGGRYGFVKVDLMGEAVPMQGNLSGSDVFTAVWAKLFGVRYDAPKCGKTKKAALKSYFLDFDFSRERVGQGAFRAYLDEITYAVYRDMLARDTVPLKDIHGRVMHDKNGKVVYVSRAILAPPQGETKGKSVDNYALKRFGEETAEKTSKKRARLLLELSYLAYYRLCADEKVCPKWFKPYAKELFEQGRGAKEVRARARIDDSVPSAGAFDKELSSLRKKIRKLRDEMFRRMYSFATIETENGRAVHVLDPNEVLEQEWKDLALWVGNRRMHDIRYNVVRAIMG